MIIIVFGLPGSGKSYFAERLAKLMEAQYVNSDKERMKLIENRDYSFTEKTLVYERMIELMEKAVRAGKTIVLDATFYRKSIRDRFVSTAEAMDETPVFIEVTADQQIIKERVAKKRKHSEADYSVYLKVKKSFEPLQEKHLVLNSSEDIEVMLTSGLNYINSSS